MKRRIAALFCGAVYFLVSAGAGAAELREGPGVGGGGGAVLCLNPDQSVRSAELVDLVESAFFDRLQLSPSLRELPWERQVELVVNRIAFADPQFYAMLIARVRSVHRELDSALEATKDTDLIFPAPQDLSHGRVPPIRVGCQLVGAAVYSDTNRLSGRLTVSHLLWRSFSETHKAALVMHEAVYLTHRDIFRNLGRDGMPDSSATRALVGFLFSRDLEQGSPTAAERARFAGNRFFRGFEFPSARAAPEAGFASKARYFLRPLLPYFLKGAERPLFVSASDCGGKDYEVLVLDDDRGGERIPGRCQLSAVAFQWPSRSEARPLQAAGSAADGSLVYGFRLRNEKLLEDLRLSCRTRSGLRRYNPGFRVRCDGRDIAIVAPTMESNVSGLSTRDKREIEQDFVREFSLR